MLNILKYEQILGQVSSKTSLSRFINAHKQMTSKPQEIDNLIRSLVSARNLMAQLCDERGHIKQEVVNTIAASIKPDVQSLEGMDLEMRAGLNCLSSIFATIQYVGTIDRILDRNDPTTFSRYEFANTAEDEILRGSVQEYLDGTILKGPKSNLTRQVLADLMHDAFWLLERITTAIGNDPKWGEKLKISLDKFCDQTGKYFMNTAVVFFSVEEGKGTRVNLNVRPEHQHLSDFAEIVSQHIQRFRYLFKDA